jgi:hypothetical protein
MAPTVTFAQSMNWLIKNSYIFANVSTGSIAVTQTTGTGANWDLLFTIQDSVIINGGAGAGVYLINSGTAANEGNGIDLLRCTVIATTGLLTSGTRNSLTNPSTAQDCLFLCTAALNAGEAGAITDLGGNISNGTYTNVTAHASSRNSAHDFPAIMMDYGHGWMWGLPVRPAFSPAFPAIFGNGLITAASTDMTGRPRPSGTGLLIESGTATSGAATTITDSGKAWKTNEHRGRLVRTTGGTGSGQVKHIGSNTATALTIGTKSGDWATTPDSTTTYIIYEGPPVETNKATSGSTTTFVVSGAAWSVNKWAGYSLAITAGTGNGETKTITSNTATTLTTAAFVATLDNTSVGSIYWPGASLTHTGSHPGAFEYFDEGLKETTTTDAGSVGLVLNGPGNHEFLIPVDAAATVITVKMRYDSNHGTTNKPRAVLLANTEIGVTTETKTMTSAADTWETLTFASQTPTAKGVVIVRLESRSDNPYGRAYADTWTVS